MGWYSMLQMNYSVTPLGSSFKARKRGIPFWRKLSEDYQVKNNYICQNEGEKRKSTYKLNTVVHNLYIWG